MIAQKNSSFCFGVQFESDLHFDLCQVMSHGILFSYLRFVTMLSYAMLTKECVFLPGLENLFGEKVDVWG